MGMEIFPPASGGGTDWSKYTQLSKQLQLSVNTVYKDILSITGKGFITACYGTLQSASSPGTFRMVIDGVDYLVCMIPSTALLACGVALQDYIAVNSSINENYIKAGLGAKTWNISSTEANLPKTDTATAIFVPIGTPIFFNSSFLLQAKINSGSSDTFNGYVRGGIQ